MQRVLALIYAVPGIGWAVATLAVLVYHHERGELPMIAAVVVWRDPRR